MMMPPEHKPRSPALREWIKARAEETLTTICPARTRGELGVSPYLEAPCTDEVRANRLLGIQRTLTPLERLAETMREEIEARFERILG
jgi:hypothetical protein